MISHLSIAALIVSLFSLAVAGEVYSREAQHHGYTQGIAYHAALVVGAPVRWLLP